MSWTPGIFFTIVAGIYRRLTHIGSTLLAVTMESTKAQGPQQGAALMTRTTKYVALDVHQATTVASVRDDSGRVLARSVGTLPIMVGGRQPLAA